MLGTNADMPAFARIQALEPLDPLAATDKTFRLDDYYAGFLKDSKYSNALYQLPFARSVPLLFANRDHLRAAGLPDALPATWGALLERGLALMRARAALPDEIAGPATPSSAAPPYAAFGSGTGWWEFQPLLWAHGGAFSDERRTVLIDSPASIAAAQFLGDLVHKHRVAAATKNVLGDFQRGGLTFFVTSTASLTQLVGGSAFDVGAAPVPSLAEQTPTHTPGSPRDMVAWGGIPGSGAGLSLIRGVHGRKQDLSWQFLRHMTSAESAAYFARVTGYTPVRPDAMRDAQLAAFYARVPAARLALTQLERLKSVDAVLSVPFANRRIEETLEQILFAGASVPQACAALAAALKRLMAEQAS
jgi:ABC-type glycerol-3-phosphate transport system substrate-binding protein